MTDGTGKRSWETSTAYLIARMAAHNMNENELERRARRIAAIKMGLVRDVKGERLPDDLWRQALPAARRELESEAVDCSISIELSAVGLLAPIPQPAAVAHVPDAVDPDLPKGFSRAGFARRRFPGRV
jgi:hypothetical protein